MKKYSTSFYRRCFHIVLSGFVAFACAKEEQPSFFKISGNGGDNKVWQADADGDTIVINFSTNIPIGKINVNNSLEWTVHRLEAERLTLYVKANGETSARSGEIAILGVEKGAILSNETVTINQATRTNKVAKKHLFTGFPKLRKAAQRFPWFPQYGNDLALFHSENLVFKMILPAEGGETLYKNIFYSNIPRDKIVTELEYEDGDPGGWISAVEPIETGKEGVIGIRFKADKLTGNAEQRRVKITLRDKDFAGLSASVRCSQVKRGVEPANPADLNTRIPMRPTPYSVLLKTDIPAEKFKLRFFDNKLKDMASDSYDDTLLEDPVFINNYVVRQPEQAHFAPHYKFRQTPDGVMLEGETSTSPLFYKHEFAIRLKQFGQTYKFILHISNEINDQVLCLFIEEKEPELYYLFFENNQKETLLNLPQEGGSFGLPPIRSNSEAIFMTGPPWASWEKRDISYWSLWIDPVYPDIYKMGKGPVKVYPNTGRKERTGEFIISCDGLSHAHIPKKKTYETSSLRLKINQAPFTGRYVFNVKTTVENPIPFNNAAENKALALETNFDMTQLKVSKSPRAGWLDYQLNSDPDTGHVVGIIFSADANTSGDDRSATCTLEGPENEGLEKIEIRFKQSK